MNLVIVESPAKARTIEKYLGKGYRVTASFGHVRDLPSKDGSIDPDRNFAMKWAIQPGSKKIISELVRYAKEADEIILATDPDREGEAISWHIVELLRQKKALGGKRVKRVVFNAITKDSVLTAMANPRTIDDDLVDAYQARRALDYLVGFNLSPVLWRKLPGARSAGRVQSVALRLVCQREREILAFKPQEYWTITTSFTNSTDQDTLETGLKSFNDIKFSKHPIENEANARKYEKMLKNASFKVADIGIKPIKNNPPAPFITSSLQQDASSRLGFSAKETMQLAQKLYEGNFSIPNHSGGLITYMRTDGVQMSAEAISACRSAISQQFGEKYLPSRPNIYKTKAKNAQEAHEAIRPVNFGLPPDKIKGLPARMLQLYRLIWSRAMASQMAPSLSERTTITINANHVENLLILSGSFMNLIFDGFWKVYQSEKQLKEKSEVKRFNIKTGEVPNLSKIECIQHFTNPPARYSDATLIKKLEELGIGRPSTYASIISILIERDYVITREKRLHPNPKGQIVTAFLEEFFKNYVEYDFTADLEDELDQISDGKSKWDDVVKNFWIHFKENVNFAVDQKNSDVLDRLNESLAGILFWDNEKNEVNQLCPKCKQNNLSLKISPKGGPFIGCSGYPECKYTRVIDPNESTGHSGEEKVLGNDPATGKPVHLKFGRYGAYVELEADPNSKTKPKRASLGKLFDPDTIDLESGLKLLSLPRTVGTHPESGEPITAAQGPYGPYVKHKTTYASLSNQSDLFEIDVAGALECFKNKKPSKRGAASKSGKILGQHPDDSGNIELKNGFYGTYISYGKLNVSIPKTYSPDSLTLEHALELIEEKQNSKPIDKKRAAPKKSKKKTVNTANAKSTAAKKPRKSN